LEILENVFPLVVLRQQISFSEDKGGFFSGLDDLKFRKISKEEIDEIGFK